MYYNGQGVPQNYAEAMKWYRKAAQQDHASAQNNLGLMFSEGHSMPPDNVQAHMWYNLAAANGPDIAAMNRDIIAAKMTSADVSTAQRLARDWLAKHGKAE